MLKSIFKNISVLLVTRILAQILAFFSTLYISRKVGVQGYGKIGYVTSILIYLDMLANLGLENYAVREVSRDYSRLNFFISHVITMRLFVSFIIYVILLVLGFTIFGLKTVFLLLLLYAFSLFFKSFSLIWTFQALSRMEFIGLGQILNQGIYLVFVLYLVHSPNDLLLVPVAFNIGYFVLVAYTWIVHRHRIKHIAIRVNFSRWKKMLQISLPIIGAYIVLRINWNVGMIILGSLGNQTAAGYFNAALKLLVLLMAIREILVTVHYPILSRFFKQDFQKLQRIMEFFIKIAVTIAMPIVLGGIIYRKEIILFLFKQKYLPAAQPLLFLLIGFGFMMINIVFPAGQNAFNRQDVYFKTSFQVAMVSVATNALFIPLYGATGAALSMAISEFVSLLLFRWRSFQVVKVQDLRLIVQLVPPLILMGLTGLFLGELHLLFKIAIMGTIYLISLLGFRVINREEINFLKSMLQK